MIYITEVNELFFIFVIAGESSVQFEETTMERSTSMTMVNMPTPPKVLKKKVLP